MTDIIPQETPLDAARLAELVLGQREAIAALTARLAAVETKTGAHSALFEAMDDAAAFRGRAGKYQPAPAPRRSPRGHLSVLRGGGAR